MNKKIKHSNSRESSPEARSKNIERFVKQLDHLKRFKGTLYDPRFQIKNKLGNLENEKAIFVAPADLLFDPDFYLETWIKANFLPISSREFPDAFSFFFLYCYLENVSLLYPDGTPFFVQEIDDLIGDDVSRCRTLSNYLQSDESGDHPNSTIRNVDLLQVIEVVARTYTTISNSI